MLPASMSCFNTIIRLGECKKCTLPSVEYATSIQTSQVFDWKVVVVQCCPKKFWWGGCSYSTAKNAVCPFSPFWVFQSLLTRRCAAFALKIFVWLLHIHVSSFPSNTAQYQKFMNSQLYFSTILLSLPPFGLWLAWGTMDRQCLTCVWFQSSGIYWPFKKWEWYSQTPTTIYPTDVHAVQFLNGSLQQLRKMNVVFSKAGRYTYI